MEESKKTKNELAIVQSATLRGLVESVNRYNSEDPEAAILREDVVSILKENDTFFLLYYR